ncbi:Forkhead-associated (FHA) domain [Arabidopsis thaliana x Arabidopsis arenosa]|uniref:Forkhead-associated (FHA) domain n=1 Tax=Arabidopsis thaliana x Arabidopsis arenosa TaxID=1240361 RepID=A0A8T2C2R5_9BRAS|nr:Forkhead-associated (FHA) domain [Arabidopsis thaliana x Arabidopsis arenosa]
MEVKEEKLMEEEQRLPEKTIPVFTVLKNGAILKNIFVVNSRDFSSPERNGSIVSDDDEEVEEILVVGRHPDCDILLTHPSISRFHLEIRSISSRQKLFVTDLSSVHGTWVRDLRVEPHTCIEVEEGDTIRIGGSTRIYRLHWIPLSRAYDIDNPFVSPLDASTVLEQEEENRMIEAENLEVAQHQSLENTASGDDGDIHLDVTSEGTGSSVLSEDEDEDEDTYVTTREMSLPLASPSVLTLAGDSVKTQKMQFDEDLQTSPKLDLDVVEAVGEKLGSSFVPSKQQSDGYVEGLGCSELFVAEEADECDVRGDGSLHLNVISERMESSVPNMTEAENLEVAHQSLANTALGDDGDLHLDLQPSTMWDLDVVEAAAEKPSSSCVLGKQQSGGYVEGLGYSERFVAAEADECDFRVRGDGGFHLNVMSERIESSVSNEEEDPFLAEKETSSLPLSTDSINPETLWLTEDVQASPEFSTSSLEANAENLSGGCSPSKEQIDGCFEASGCSAFELAAEVEILSLHREVSEETEFVTKEVMGVSAEPLAKADILSHEENGEIEGSRQVIEVSPNSFSQAEPTLETLTGKAQGLVGSEFLSGVAVETESENLLLQKSIGETKAEIRSHNDYKETECSCSVIAVSLSSVSEPEPTLEILTDEARCLLGSEFLSEMAVETEIDNLLHQKSNGETKADIQSHEDYGETDISRQVIAVSPNSFSQAETTLETVVSRQEARGLVGSDSEFQSEVAIETECENLLNQKSNGETKVSSRQSSAVSDCLFTGKDRLSSINTEDIQSLCSSWQPLSESEVGAPSEIRSDVTPARDQNQKSGMTSETEKIFDDGNSSCLSEDLKQSCTQSFLSTPNQKLNAELLIGSGRSEKYYSLSEIEGEENTDIGRLSRCPIPLALAAGSFEDTKPIEELSSDDTGSQKNQTPQTHAVKNDVLSEMDSSSTCNIWSRRGKAASALQIRTNKSQGKQKQIGRQPKDKLHRKQALTVHHGAENLEPEIFTPDKENLTPSSHMLKRLQDIGDVKDSKSSSKLSGKSCSSLVHSSIAILASEAFTEPEIFTPDKENLTPNSHMLKRLREFGDIKDTKGSSSKATRKPFFDIHLEYNLMAEQKPEDLHSMSSKSKVKHEPLAPKKKAERAPFQPLLEKSSSQSQSYTEASSTASARKNISRGVRSSSILSDGKSKMKWTIVVDTSSLLDKESRKPLHLLQGLKGTHLVLPRTVLREVNEVKRSRSFLFRRRTEMASSALDWIEECKVNTKWWIQVQSPSEETKATAPTPPVTPQSNGSAFPFSLHWNNYAPEIDSPTSEDQVLECALLYRNRNRDEKLVLLSNDVTLKIKAMAEGVICETPQEFYESLVNPFSERFMWTESTARGRTWSHLDDVVLRERYNNRACRKTSTFNGGRGESGAAAKGLKLILLHNSHYGHTH